MTVFAIDFKKSTIRAFKSERSARNMGNGLVLFTSADELLENRNTTGRGLVEVYNNCADKPVKKFTDNKTGASRIFKLAQDIHVESTPFDEVDAKPVEVVASSAAKAGAKKPRGKFVDKCIKVLVDENPRRAGGHGHKMMEWLLAENKKLGGGIIEYADYVAAGGRPQDLQWDLDRNWVEIV